MFKYLESLEINEVFTKYILLSILVLLCLFLAFNHHPPILSNFEIVEIYDIFLPTKKPPLIFAVSEDPVTNSTQGTFDYAALVVSRYVSDYIGHSVSNVKLPSVIYSLIALFLFYTITNRFFDWKIALISTLLLSTNQYFLMFQHFLMVHMVTLTTILFCIERFQNLNTKKNRFAIVSFGFACALTTLQYWMGRWCMMSILFFYLLDFEKFSIFKYRSYLHFTNWQRIKTILLVFLCMIAILTIVYPANILTLFNSDFIFPSSRVGEFSNEISRSFYNVWINLLLFFKHFIFDRSNYPSHIMVNSSYPAENIIIFFLSILGIIISLIRKISYSILFVLFIFFITFFPQLLSETFVSAETGDISSTINSGRVLFFIPFACIMAVLGIRYIYTYFASNSYLAKPVFIFLIGLFFCFRLYGYFAEINRFNNEIVNSYKIDFTQPAPVDNIDTPSHARFNIPTRGLHYNQVYYYQIAQFILNHLEKTTSTSNSTKLLYVPAEIYTPSKYKMLPEGYPYYFPMFLTFYLQEQGINVSYLVKKKDIKERFLKKVIEVLDRYKQGKNLSPDNTLPAVYYPRTKIQEKSVKMFINIINWIESFKKGKKWLDSIREQTNHSPNMFSIGDYFVNVTSNKSPDHLIITNLEELDLIKEQYDYELALSMPIK